jgi:hypothetical protein
LGFKSNFGAGHQEQFSFQFFKDAQFCGGFILGLKLNILFFLLLNL